MQNETESLTLTNRKFVSSEALRRQIENALPSHVKPDYFIRVAMTALTKTPDLQSCDQMTLARCLMDCAQMGLPPDGRHAHLIPYRNNKSHRTDCQLIIDYKGLMALARRSGDVSIFRAELVKEKDEFEWNNSVVTHRINFREDRGKTQCVYSYVKFKDGQEDYEVMTLEEVDAIRRRSRAANAGPWVTDYDEMAKKTVIRRHSKRLTLSPEFMDALEKDDDRHERNVTPAVKAPRLLDLAGEPEPPAEPSPAPAAEDDGWDGDSGEHDGKGDA